MRIAELSRRTGVPVPTIKYYRREGLLPPGEHTSPNQALYGEEHVHRIRLIRALVEVGGLPIAGVRDLLAAVDARALSLHDTLGTALHRLIPARAVPAGETWTTASHDLDDVLRQRGWQYEPDSPPLRTAAAVLATMRELGGPDYAQRPLLEVYAGAVERMAAAEIALVSGHQANVDRMVEGAVLGAALGSTLIASLRLLAQESASGKLFGQDQPSAAEPEGEAAAGDASPG